MNIQTFNKTKNENLQKLIVHDDLQFSINEEEKTASLIKSFSQLKDIQIPRSILYENQEYIITSISSKAFEYSKAESIEFSSDSELRTIKEEAFRCSEIKSISIPSSTIEFEKGWCNYAYHLNDITIIQNKEHITSKYNDKFIIKKSIPKSDTYDILIFLRRDVEEITIPSFIKKIAPHAFNYCNKLKAINFSENSELSIIENEAFIGSSIESISILPQITKIGEKAFYSCHKLSNIEIPINSQLKKIENSSFIFTSIESISIPSEVTEIGQNAFEICKSLRQINFQINSKLQLIDKFAFKKSFIQSITIPTHVTCINSYAFSSCKNLQKVEFSKNSELKEIGEYAFSKCKFESITIPSHVKSISKSAFFHCKNLKKIEFTSDSELQIIGSSAFQGTSLESILIPSHVTHICDNAFIFCDKLRKFEISHDSELNLIDDGAFCASSIESIVIPSDVELREGWCRQTSNLKEIVIIPREKQNIFLYENKFLLGKSRIENDFFDVILFARRDITYAVIPSFIKKIGYGSFFSCEKLEKISISSHVKTIGMSAFHSCQKLHHIEIQNNPELKEIGNYAFINTQIKSFSIPPHVNEIGTSAFINCSNLQIVEIDENSELKNINIKDFFRWCIIMIPQKLIHIFN